MGRRENQTVRHRDNPLCHMGQGLSPPLMRRKWGLPGHCTWLYLVTLPKPKPVCSSELLPSTRCCHCVQPQSSTPTGIDTQSPRGGGAQAAASSDSGAQSSGRLPLRILPSQHLSLGMSASHWKPTPSRGTKQI